MGICRADIEFINTIIDLRNQVRVVRRDLTEVRKELEMVKMRTYLARWGFTAGVSLSKAHKINIDDAVEQIAAHLGLEFKTEPSVKERSYLAKPPTLWDRIRSLCNAK